MAFTYFFRDRQTLELIIDRVLPTLRGYRYIRIWDAGCAHGPEPYSIAMMLRENMSHFLFRNVRIHATDLDRCNQFGPIIGAGIYPEGEVKRIPSEIKRKYFKKADRPNHYKIAEEIRTRVEFTKHDLLSLEPPRDGFGLIVCKNVLLHLTDAQRVDVVKMFHHALRDGGFLVTEQTQPLPDRCNELFEPITCKGRVLRKVGVDVRECLAA